MMFLAASPSNKSFTLSRSKPMPDLDDYMTSEVAAKKLGFNVKSIRNMLNAKTLDGIKLGREWLVSKKSVEKYQQRTKGMSKNDPRRSQN